MKNLFSKIRSLYWQIWPYDYRPFEVWYRLKCFCWHRYTTTQPRTMPWHSWTDRCDLLPHTIMEIFCQFWEKEVNGGHVDWQASNHTIKINDKEVNVYDVWQDIYIWWNDRYLKLYDKTNEEWFQFYEQHAKSEFTPIPNSQLLSWDTKYDSEENKQECDRLFNEYQNLEQKLEEELIENMVLICKTHRSMWT